MAGAVTIKFGPNEGRRIAKPNNFDSIESEDDKNAVAVTCIAMLRTLDDISYMEVEGTTSCGSFWILSAYGWRKRPTPEDVSAIRAQAPNVDIETVFVMNSKESIFHTGLCAKFGAIVVHVRKWGAVPLLSSFSFADDRKTEILHARNVKSASTSLIPVKGGKRLTPKKKVKAIMKNRSFMTRVWDSLLGVSPEGVLQTIGQETDLQSNAFRSLDE